MKWKKLGKIFDPREHLLSNGCTIFSKSPQALVFDDFIKIYFSSQKRTANGKYISHVQFVDMDMNFKTIIDISNTSVIKLGGIGTFDEHGIFPVNTVKYKDKIYAYTSGWSRRTSVSIDMAIGLAISNDSGRTFNKYGDGPVMAATLDEPFLVGDPFVKVINGMFHMWYIFGIQWRRFFSGSEPDRIYKIGHATSIDGIHWERGEGAIIKDKYLDESQALPTVLKIKDMYHMLYSYRKSSDFRKNREKSYRIGYAYSSDLKSWTRDDKNVGIDVSESGWDSDMMCYPNMFECDNKVYLLYNGNEFGKYGFGLALLESD